MTACCARLQVSAMSGTWLLHESEGICVSSKSHQDHEEKHGPGLVARLRNYFLTGLIIAGPIGITIWLTWTFIQWIDRLMKPFIPSIYNPETYLPIPIPGIGLIAAAFGLILIGFLAANFAGRTVLSMWELLFSRMPVVRSVYGGLKQIFETVLSETGSSFQKAGLIEYPRRGLWAVVFIATDARGEVSGKLRENGSMVSVFLPTTPNPTSGFLLFVPKRDVIELNMSVEDAAKLVISAGLVAPDPERPGELITAPQDVAAQ